MQSERQYRRPRTKLEDLRGDAGSLPTPRRCSPSTPIAQRINQQGKGRRRLAATGVVEVITRERRAPVSQHPDESAIDEVHLHLILGQIRQAESRQRCVEHQSGFVEYELPFDPHPQLASPLLELPGVEPTMRW